MRQQSNPVQVTLLMLAMLFIGMPSQAERYRDDGRHALQRYAERLQDKQTQLRQLLAMRQQLDDWRARLDAQNKALDEEMARVREDKRQVEEGRMSRADLNRKWVDSGRAQEHDRQIQRFQQEVKEYNNLLQSYNTLAQDLAKHIQHRTPQAVQELVTQLHSLVTALQHALDNNQIDSARAIARNSPLAVEFGYQTEQ